MRSSHKLLNLLHPEMYESLPYETSVIGSFPYSSEIEKWVRIQQLTRVDFPCVQGDMIDMFLADKNVHGIRKTEKGYVLESYELYVSGPVQHDYLKLIYGKAKEIGYKPRGLTIPVSGPFTLSERISIPGGEGRKLIQFEDILKLFTEKIVVPIVRLYDREFSNCIIRIDEPIAQSGVLTGSGPGLYEMESVFISETLNTVFKEISTNNIPAIHVCGDISSISSIIREVSNVKIISHDFASPESFESNLNSYSRKYLEGEGKILGFGCVDSGKTRIESREEVAEKVKKAIEKFGRGNLHFHPSCGFGGFASEKLLEEELENIIVEKMKLIDYARNLN